MNNFLTNELLDLDQTISRNLFNSIKYPWQALPLIQDFVIKIGNLLPGENYEKIKDNVWVAKNSKISDNCRILGPAIVDENAEIRFGVFIRGAVIVGQNNVVGNSSELKNCILFNNVHTPHFNYIGDSILGYKTHLGAGVILSNVRSDRKEVVINYEDKKFNSGLKKFGSVLGDGVEVGCNAVLNPGTLVGRNSIIYPLSMVRKVVKKESIHKNNGEIVKII
ncbi:MAG: UDP-N-acetylglucosamine pyrophosphorylase [Candidatus Improbicoccus pseudotrichonymphae]|uniref:UDP-N-acetylglucosamine pyrophosphorylase n=1 Tax=Candidatus Improbicoccus pseudotrichonymphae TaxID=3033792 RepID=A0AA48L0W8_9FIRM|nr:MAG: UDP-N-acetylglucosamine pyrophosphorylase [Candidatus Improbicoccus pseudotrichonymphae]